MAVHRDRWRLTETVRPFPATRLPRGEEGTGRLVRVQVQSGTGAVFSARHTLVGAGLALPVLADFSGEASLERDRIRITVSASAANVLVVGALSGVFLLGGLQLFLGQPGLGTALAGGVPIALASWLLRQIPKAGREVAADVAQVLETMTRGRRGLDGPGRP